MTSIIRKEIGGGSVVIDYKHQIVTFEEEVDAQQLSNYEIMDCLMFDIIWRGLHVRKAPPYHEGHGVGIRMRDGWLLRGAELFVNCILMDYINVIVLGEGDRQIYIENQKVEVDNRGRVLLGPDQNQIAWIQIMDKPEDYEVTFIGAGIFDLSVFKHKIFKNQGLSVPINCGS